MYLSVLITCLSRPFVLQWHRCIPVLACALLGLFFGEIVRANEVRQCHHGFPVLPTNGITLDIRESDVTSILRIIDQGEYRSLQLKESGVDKVLARINLLQPDIPIQTEKQAFLASFLLTPVQGRSLIVGLYNIGLIKFLRSYTPAQPLDVVETSAVLTEAMQTWFGLDRDERLTIRQAQELIWLQTRPHNYYDVIYMDADALIVRRLLDSAGSDALVRAMWNRLTGHGVLLAALVGDRQQVEREIDSVLTVFPHIFVWENPDNKTVMLAAFKHRQIVNPLILRERARKLDQSLGSGFSFTALIDRLLAGEYRVLEI